MRRPSPRLASRCTHRVTRASQRGFVAAAAVLLLIATVLYALTQLQSVSSMNVNDGQRQSDSTEAFFVAESGLETGKAALTTALVGTVTNATCTGIGSTTTIGRGSATITAVSTPAVCDSSGATPCTSCKVTSVGTVGAATRTVNQGLALTVNNGVVCNTTNPAGTNCTNSSAVTWKLSLTNNTGSNAIAIFDLGYPGQGNVATACGALSNCQKQVDFSSPTNGAGSVGMMTNAVVIPTGNTYPIYQTFPSNKNSDVAEVGALFTGTSPSLTGPATPGGAAYWNSSTTTGRSTDNGGTTNDGTLTSSGTCSAPSASSQACTNWCYGGDTLVLSYAANTTSTSDQLNNNSVLFNTAGTPAQNVALTRVTKYPTSLISGAPVDVETEVWYAQNRDYLSDATATSGGQVTGSVGATFTATTTTGSNVLNVTAISSGLLHVGDVITCSGTGTCPAILSSGTTTIASQASGTAGSTGNYTLSASCAASCGSRADKTTSTKLEVTAVSNGYLSVGDAITGTGVIAGTTVTAIVGAGNVVGSYTLNTAQNVAAATVFTANGPTIHVTGGTVPAGGVPLVGTLLNVFSGTGVLTAQSHVAASTPSATATLFKLDQTPTTRLVNAQLCGGTCAFFDHTRATTAFSFTKTAGTNQWTAGFVCLKGFPTPQIVTSSSTGVAQWNESIN